MVALVFTDSNGVDTDITIEGNAEISTIGSITHIKGKAIHIKTNTTEKVEEGEISVPGVDDAIANNGLSLKRHSIVKEIPFRKAPSRIQGIYINEIREKIEKKGLLKLYDSYFWFTIKALENASKRLKKNGKLCVLIGNPKMNGVEVEIWKVFYEYFINNLGLKGLEVYEDKIITRKLFKG